MSTFFCLRRGHPAGRIECSLPGIAIPAATTSPAAARRLLGLTDALLEYADDETVVLALSDHGFGTYRREFHVNTWLLENGYLALKEGAAQPSASYLTDIDWSRTKAYALGLNGLYLNVRGREKQGIVAPGKEYQELLKKKLALDDELESSASQK